jgi:hypothetical protein
MILITMNKIINGNFSNVIGECAVSTTTVYIVGYQSSLYRCISCVVSRIFEVYVNYRNSISKKTETQFGSSGMLDGERTPKA